MKKSFLLIISVLSTAIAFAQEVATIDGIKYYLYNGEAMIMIQDQSLSGNIVIPETVSYNGTDYAVTSVANKAFQSTAITSIALPDGIKSVGDECFKDCSSLISVTLPDGITFLGDYCFANCGKLTSIILPEIITSLGDYCFSRCSNLTYITLPDGITSLGDYCFLHCWSLTSITLPESTTSSGEIILPESITSLGEGCFAHCYSFTSVVLPESITSLKNFCFEGCTGLTSVTLPESITSLGYECFSGCSGLTSITLPESITSLGYGCFSGCSGLTSITLPESITSLGSGCFRNCTGLTSITLPDGITSLGEAFFLNCTSLTSITLPAGITSLGKFCFEGCRSLTSITLPESITSLYKACFGDCSDLTSITLPNSITFLDDYCFSGCSSLLTVTCKWESLDKVYVAANAFDEIYSDSRLYVPKGTVEIYKAKEPWSNFKYIGEVDGGTPSEPEKCAMPTISYEEKQLVFTSETDGAEYHYTITAPDIKTDAYSADGRVQLAAAYEISVYASADGYTNSDVATATLYFMDAGFDIGTNIANVADQRGVLVSRSGQYITVSGLDDGETASLYTVSGQLLSTSRAVAAGTVTLDTKNESGVLILKTETGSMKIKN